MSDSPSLDELDIPYMYGGSVFGVIQRVVAVQENRRGGGSGAVDTQLPLVPLRLIRVPRDDELLAVVDLRNEPSENAAKPSAFPAQSGETIS